MTELCREQGVHTGKYREHAQKHIQTPRKITLKLKNIQKIKSQRKSQQTNQTSYKSFLNEVPLFAFGRLLKNGASFFF